MVLDPVFLLLDAEYKRLIADDEERVPRGEYVFTYILDQTDEKQWEQLEDHRLRLDGVDARNGEQDDRINRLEQDYKKSVVTEKKQWDQLEDHRLRLDGIDAKDKATMEALGQMSYMIQELEQQNSILKEQVDTGEQNIALLEQQLQQLKKWSFMYWLRRIFKGKS